MVIDQYAQLVAPYLNAIQGGPASPNDPVYGNGGDSLMDLATQMMSKQGAPSGVDSTFIGGTGDFNATHEGPGTSGLTFGEGSQYTSLAEAVLAAVRARFPQVTSGGIQANRNIAGTNTPSEHAYGAALDLMVGSNKLGDRVYRYLSRPRIADKYDYSNILWEVPDHYNHLHVGWLY